jgi:hypothetical protein
VIGRRRRLRDIVLKDAKTIRDYIDRRMTEETMTFKEPKGLLDVARQVKLFVGEGDDRVEIGVADIEKMSSGDSAVLLTITDENVARLLGGSQIKGLIPRLTDVDPNQIRTDEETS